MTIPYANATLTEVRAAGTTADYDVPAVDGASRWSGVLGVYVADEMTEVEGAGVVDVLVKTRVEVPYAAVGRLIQQGDYLAYTGPDGVAYDRRVDSFVSAALVNRTRVILDDL